MQGIDTDGLLTIIGAVILLAGGIGALLAPFQKEISEAVFTWAGTPSAQKPVVNFAIGIVLATVLMGAAALYVTDWRLLGAGLIAGMFSSTQAAKGHDAEKVAVMTERANDATGAAYEQGRQDTIAAARDRRQRAREGDRRQVA